MKRSVIKRRARVYRVRTAGRRAWPLSDGEIAFITAKGWNDAVMLRQEFGGKIRG